MNTNSPDLEKGLEYNPEKIQYHDISQLQNTIRTLQFFYSVFDHVDDQFVNKHKISNIAIFEQTILSNYFLTSGIDLTLYLALSSLDNEALISLRF